MYDIPKEELENRIEEIVKMIDFFKMLISSIPEDEFETRLKSFGIEDKHINDPNSFLFKFDNKRIKKYDSIDGNILTICQQDNLENLLFIGNNDIVINKIEKK